MRRVTDVTKEMPVSRQVSCSTFSSRLLVEERGKRTQHRTRERPRAKERGPGGPGACDGSRDGRLTTLQSHLG